MKFTEELKTEFMEVAPALIGHYKDGGFMKPFIRPVWRFTPDDVKMVGQRTWCDCPSTTLS